MGKVSDLSEEVARLRSTEKKINVELEDEKQEKENLLKVRTNTSIVYI